MHRSIWKPIGLATLVCGTLDILRNKLKLPASELINHTLDA